MDEEEQKKKMERQDYVQFLLDQIARDMFDLKIAKERHDEALKWLNQCRDLKSELGKESAEKSKRIKELMTEVERLRGLIDHIHAA
ncbi:hypothetical protein B7463_g5011, partial [Scytalidium lignicola]